MKTFIPVSDVFHLHQTLVAACERLKDIDDIHLWTDLNRCRAVVSVYLIPKTEQIEVEVQP